MGPSRALNPHGVGVAGSAGGPGPVIAPSTGAIPHRHHEAMPQLPSCFPSGTACGFKVNQNTARVTSAALPTKLPNSFAAANPASHWTKHNETTWTQLQGSCQAATTLGMMAVGSTDAPAASNAAARPPPRSCTEAVGVSAAGGAGTCGSLTHASRPSLYDAPVSVPNKRRKSGHESLSVASGQDAIVARTASAKLDLTNANSAAAAPELADARLNSARYGMTKASSTSAELDMTHTWAASSSSQSAACATEPSCGAILDVTTATSASSFLTSTTSTSISTGMDALCIRDHHLSAAPHTAAEKLLSSCFQVPLTTPLPQLRLVDSPSSFTGQVSAQQATSFSTQTLQVAETAACGSHLSSIQAANGSPQEPHRQHATVFTNSKGNALLARQTSHTYAFQSASCPHSPAVSGFQPPGVTGFSPFEKNNPDAQTSQNHHTGRSNVQPGTSSLPALQHAPTSGARTLAQSNNVTNVPSLHPSSPSHLALLAALHPSRPATAPIARPGSPPEPHSLIHSSQSLNAASNSVPNSLSSSDSSSSPSSNSSSLLSSDSSSLSSSDSSSLLSSDSASPSIANVHSGSAPASSPAPHPTPRSASTTRSTSTSNSGWSFASASSAVSTTALSAPPAPPPRYSFQPSLKPPRLARAHAHSNSKKDRKLTSRIKDAQSISALQSLVTQQKTQFNAIHTSAAVYKLAVLVKDSETNSTRQSPDSRSGQQQPVPHNRSSDRTIHEIGSSSCRALAEQLLNEHLLPLFMSRLHCMGMRSIANSVWSFATLDYHPGLPCLEAIINKLLDNNGTLLGQGNPQEWSNLLWALALLSQHAPGNDDGSHHLHVQNGYMVNTGTPASNASSTLPLPSPPRSYTPALVSTPQSHTNTANSRGGSTNPPTVALHDQNASIPQQALFHADSTDRSNPSMNQHKPVQPSELYSTNSSTGESYIPTTDPNETPTSSAPSLPPFLGTSNPPQHTHQSHAPHTHNTGCQSPTTPSITGPHPTTTPAAPESGQQDEHHLHASNIHPPPPLLPSPGHISDQAPTLQDLRTTVQAPAPSDSYASHPIPSLQDLRTSPSSLVPSQSPLNPLRCVKSTSTAPRSAAAAQQLQHSVRALFQQLFSSVAATALPHLYAYTPQNMANTALAFAKLHIATRRLPSSNPPSQSGPNTPPHTQHTAYKEADTQDNIEYSTHRMNYATGIMNDSGGRVVSLSAAAPDNAFLQTLCQVAVLKLPEFSAQELSSLLWSVVSLGLFHPGLITSAAREVIQRSSTLNHAPSQQYYPPAHPQSAPSHPSHYDLPLQQQSAPSQPPSPPPPYVASKLPRNNPPAASQQRSPPSHQPYSPAQMSQLCHTPQHVSTTMWAFAKAGYFHPELVAVLSAAARQALPRFTLQDSCNALWALGEWRVYNQLGRDLINRCFRMHVLASTQRESATSWIEPGWGPAGSQGRSGRELRESADQQDVTQDVHATREEIPCPGREVLSSVEEAVTSREDVGGTREERRMEEPVSWNGHSAQPPEGGLTSIALLAASVHPSPEVAICPTRPATWSSGTNETRAASWTNRVSEARTLAEEEVTLVSAPAYEALGLAEDRHRQGAAGMDLDGADLAWLDPIRVGQSSGASLERVKTNTRNTAAGRAEGQTSGGTVGERMKPIQLVQLLRACSLFGLQHVGLCKRVVQVLGEQWEPTMQGCDHDNQVWAARRAGPGSTEFGAGPGSTDFGAGPGSTEFGHISADVLCNVVWALALLIASDPVDSTHSLDQTSRSQFGAVVNAQALAPLCAKAFAALGALHQRGCEPDAEQTPDHSRTETQLVQPSRARQQNDRSSSSGEQGNRRSRSLDNSFASPSEPGLEEEAEAVHSSSSSSAPLAGPRTKSGVGTNSTSSSSPPLVSNHDQSQTDMQDQFQTDTHVAQGSLLGPPLGLRHLCQIFQAHITVVDTLGNDLLTQHGGPVLAAAAEQAWVSSQKRTQRFLPALHRALHRGVMSACKVSFPGARVWSGKESLDGWFAVDVVVERGGVQVALEVVGPYDLIRNELLDGAVDAGARGVSVLTDEAEALRYGLIDEEKGGHLRGEGGSVVGQVGPKAGQRRVGQIGSEQLVEEASLGNRNGVLDKSLADRSTGQSLTDRLTSQSLTDRLTGQGLTDRWTSQAMTEMSIGQTLTDRWTGQVLSRQRKQQDGSSGASVRLTGDRLWRYRRLQGRFGSKQVVLVPWNMVAGSRNDLARFLEPRLTVALKQSNEW